MIIKWYDVVYILIKTAHIHNIYTVVLSSISLKSLHWRLTPFKSFQNFVSESCGEWWTIWSDYWSLAPKWFSSTATIPLIWIFPFFFKRRPGILFPTKNLRYRINFEVPMIGYLNRNCLQKQKQVWEVGKSVEIVSWHFGYVDLSQYGISCHLVLTFRTLIDLFNFPEAQKYCCSISEVPPLFQDMLSVLSAVHHS